MTPRVATMELDEGAPYTVDTLANRLSWRQGGFVLLMGVFVGRIATWRNGRRLAGASLLLPVLVRD